MFIVSLQQIKTSTTIIIIIASECFVLKRNPEGWTEHAIIFLIFSFGTKAFVRPHQLIVSGLLCGIEGEIVGFLKR